MQKEGKPDEATWHARTAPRLIEFAAAAAFLWGTVAYAMRPPTKAVKVTDKDGKEEFIPYEPVKPVYEPSGPPSPYEPLPPGYKDQFQLIDEGKLEPPTKVTYNQNLLDQLPGMEGYTWKSGLTHDQKVDLGVYDPPMVVSPPPPPEIVIERVPTVTVNENLLRQPAEMEGKTWRSGLTHQQKVDLGLIEP